MVKRRKPSKGRVNFQLALPNKEESKSVREVHIQRDHERMEEIRRKVREDLGLTD